EDQLLVVAVGGQKTEPLEHARLGLHLGRRVLLGDALLELGADLVAREHAARDRRLDAEPADRRHLARDLVGGGDERVARRFRRSARARLAGRRSLRRRHRRGNGNGRFVGGGPGSERDAGEDGEAGADHAAHLSRLAMPCIAGPRAVGCIPPWTSRTDARRRRTARPTTSRLAAWPRAWPSWSGWARRARRWCACSAARARCRRSPSRAWRRASRRASARWWRSLRMKRVHQIWRAICDFLCTRIIRPTI